MPNSADTSHSLHGTYAKANSIEDFVSNFRRVEQRIVEACLRVGRDPQSVRLLPVSKTFAEEDLRLAYAAGCRDFGENKVQEAQRKAENMQDLEDIRWSVIGHLQTNKAKYVARFASEFQALDNLKVAATLDKCLAQQGRCLDVFVQVNTSNEASKYGISPEELIPFVEQLQAFKQLRITGLMTLAIFSTDVQQVRACFQRLRELRSLLHQQLASSSQIDQLSMGMSGDFEIAIEEGATVVRVGQAIFGARATPDAYYWPTQENN
ncbi:hypothetical protein AKN87_09275 [Thiopseudomonas alkaliphila]|uniref:YggS family pyridoxal phosphate-dependent enzyme n=1 Tax=Thiopseudomonas alkaliphila TaxID=1697053 RepID=UPI00069FEE0F|nr:YggS family pyridoxal phosphate-dependent enzyme [Thiopseudomonas alkaliphila]AKX45255.1 hypothetical protein AKN87_09275 [Thiopseudomonas alkaliphila]